MDIHAKTNIIRRTMAVMGRNSIAKSLGLAKFLIDRTKHEFNNTAGLISARGTCCGSLCAFHTTDEIGNHE
jgi:hypothetical protein